MAQYIYSITVFAANNRQFFMENSELYDIKTGNNKNLSQPQSNISVYQRGPHYAGITHTHTHTHTHIYIYIKQSSY